MPMKHDLLKLAKEVSELKKIPMSRLARKVVFDNKFFDRLEAGGDCTTQTYERVMQELRQLKAGAVDAEHPASDRNA